MLPQHLYTVLGTNLSVYIFKPSRLWNRVSNKWNRIMVDTAVLSPLWFLTPAPQRALMGIIPPTTLFSQVISLIIQDRLANYIDLFIQGQILNGVDLPFTNLAFSSSNLKLGPAAKFI